MTLARCMVLMAASMVGSVVQLPVLGWLTRSALPPGDADGISCAVDRAGLRHDAADRGFHVRDTVSLIWLGWTCSLKKVSRTVDSSSMMRTSRQRSLKLHAGLPRSESAAVSPTVRLSRSNVYAKARTLAFILRDRSAEQEQEHERPAAPALDRLAAAELSMDATIYCARGYSDSSKKPKKARPVR